jgi:sulfur-oxidizing protein SoxX
MRYITITSITLLIAGSLACGTSHKSASGFHFPDGDAERGKVAFIDLKCYNCHQVAGVEMPPSEISKPIVLGGITPFVKTDGQFVTAIVDPSHRFGSRYAKLPDGSVKLSRMARCGGVATVSQLVDLVTFLQSQYELQPVQWSKF